MTRPVRSPPKRGDRIAGAYSEPAGYVMRSVLGAMLAIAIAAIVVSCGDDDGERRRPSGAAGSGGSGGGSGGSGGSGGTGGQETEVIDVDGQVIDADGEPILGAFVFLNEDFENNLLTDTQGRFSARQVEAPYTLTVLRDKQVVHLVGLMNPEPVIVATDTLQFEQLVRFKGETSLEPPIPDKDWLACAVAEAHECVLEWNRETGEFSVDLKFVGGLEREQGDLVFLHTRVVDDATEFLKAALVSDLDFGPDVAQSGLEANLSLNAVTFETSVDVEPGAYDSSVMAVLRNYTVEGVTFYRTHVVPVGEPFDVPTEGGFIRVVGRDAHGVYAYQTVRAEKGKMEIRLPEKSQMRIVRPKQNQAVPPSPEVEWTRVDGAHSYLVEVTIGAGNLVAVLPADRTSLRIPDLRAYGMDHAIAHIFGIRALPPEAKVDPEAMSKAGPGLFGLTAMESGTHFAAGVSFLIQD